MEQKSSRAFFKLSVGEFREMSRFMKLRVTNDGAEKRGEPLFVHFRWLLLKKKIWQLVAADKVGFNEACNWLFHNKPGFFYYVFCYVQHPELVAGSWMHVQMCVYGLSCCPLWP